MLFSIVACLLALLLVGVSARVAKRAGDASAFARVSEGLRRHAPLSELAPLALGEPDLLQLMAALDGVSSRPAAVAAVNEFTRELEAGGTEALVVPKMLGRVCFSIGLLLFLVALARALARSAGALASDDLLHAAAALVAGVVGGGVCYQIGHKANRRRLVRRDQARALLKLLRERLPPESS